MMIRSNGRIFAAELAGTFIVVVCATGSVVLDAQHGGALGIPFVALTPFAGVAAGVYLFGRTSMAHFNPAVTAGFFITGHASRAQIPYYIAAELAGAVLGSLFVLGAVGSEANLGANAPNLHYPVWLVFSAEALATGLLMGVILAVVYTGGLRRFGGIAIGGIIGLDIFFLASVSGASMNPARSLAPALLSGVTVDLWLYWSATFAGACAVALLFRRTRRPPGARRLYE